VRVTKPSRIAVVIAVTAVAAVGGYRSIVRKTPDGIRADRASRRGGGIVVSVRSDPRSFNRLSSSRDSTTDLVSILTQAKLARINRATQELEPWLAEGWTRSDDGLRYTVKLRPNLTFSDGHPFTADDVAFSFAAVYDTTVGSVLADSLQVGGEALRIEVLDPLSVAVTFPSPFGPGLRILDNLPILPRHKLESALEAGAFARAWNVKTPPSDIVGLGPFVLAEYLPGQRMVFARNTRYWRTDQRGAPLPYLDRVTIEIIPEQDSELLRLTAGELDMLTDAVRPMDYAPLKQAADAGRLKLLDLGVAIDSDSLWFNLVPGGLGDDPRARWLQKAELRHAVSMAVDRQLFADTVFLGAGVPVYSLVTAANTQWYWTGTPQTPYDPGRARQLLASIGLVDRTGNGVLEDDRNQPARFTILIQKGKTSLERGAAVIRNELRKIGLVVDVVALDPAAVVQRFTSGEKYDAVYFSVIATDTDPALNLDFWRSSGMAHVWNVAQESPATDWERQVDELIARQIASTDQSERKRLFDQVQAIFARELPIINFSAPKIYVAASARVLNLMPAIARPQLLWSADTLAVNDGGADGTR
jgi:peptide/nickel transport system substrate-binding protein